MHQSVSGRLTFCTRWFSGGPEMHSGEMLGPVVNPPHIHSPQAFKVSSPGSSLRDGFHSFLPLTSPVLTPAGGFTSSWRQQVCSSPSLQRGQWKLPKWYQMKGQDREKTVTFSCMIHHRSCCCKVTVPGCDCKDAHSHSQMFIDMINQIQKYSFNRLSISQISLPMKT